MQCMELHSSFITDGLSKLESHYHIFIMGIIIATLEIRGNSMKCHIACVRKLPSL